MQLLHLKKPESAVPTPMNDIIIYNQRSGMLMFHKPFDTVFERDFG